MAGELHGRRDGQCSGRYTPYWNAFLFFFTFTMVKIRLNVITDAMLILEDNISAHLKLAMLSQIQKSSWLVCAKTF